MNLPLRSWLGFFLTMILPIVLCPRLRETTALSVYIRSKESTPGCCSSEWLMQLQQSWCPLLRLLMLGLVVLPIYNVVLVLVGTKSNAKHLVLERRPVKRPAPPPPPPPPPVVPPKPPPRMRRSSAATPGRRLSTSEPNPSHKNPFGCSPRDQEQYQILRRNLQLVLKGLQNPPPPEVPPPRLPEPIVEPSEMASACPSEYPRCEAQKKRSKVIFKRLWQHWRGRSNLKKSKKSLISVSSSSCSSCTNGSSSFYVYLEETNQPSSKAAAAM